MANAETHIQRTVVSALEALGHWVVRVNAGGVRVSGGGWYRGATAGTPDLCLPALGWLEVKTREKSSRLSKAQKEWHARAGAHGVRVAVVRSAAEAIDVVAKWEGARGLER